MSTPSNKSSEKEERTAQAPQRSNGKLRVASILEAAAAIISEKGYEAMTMAEVATRSDTKIGSLYRFFPNKETLADTLVVGARDNLDAVFDKFDDGVMALSLQVLTDNLLSLLFELNNSPAIVKLLDASENWSIKREEFRSTVLQRIAKTLTIYCPSLDKTSSDDMALVILLVMKAVAAQQEMLDSAPGAIEEVRDMVRLYLTTRLNRRKSS